MSDWELVGKIGVDAGLCWVGDPCYCVTPDADEHPAESWGEFVDKLYEDKQTCEDYKQWNYKKGHPGLGVTVSTGYGDGSYPVYIKRKGDRIAEVRVIFIPEDEDVSED